MHFMLRLLNRYHSLASFPGSNQYVARLGFFSSSHQPVGNQSFIPFLTETDHLSLGSGLSILREGLHQRSGPSLPTLPEGGVTVDGCV